MTEYTSEVKTIPYGSRNVFSTLSDLSNLERLKDRIPKEQVGEFSCDTDSCTIDIHPAGTVTFRIVRREPDKTIKFEMTGLPIPMYFWIQLKPADEHVTRMKLTLRADLNPMLKPMLAKPLKDAVEKVSTFLSTLPYE
jgi:carbon monoxide dehydrogenase subunit G